MSAFNYPLPRWAPIGFEFEYEAEARRACNLPPLTLTLTGWVGNTPQFRDNEGRESLYSKAMETACGKALLQSRQESHA